MIVTSNQETEGRTSQETKQENQRNIHCGVREIEVVELPVVEGDELSTIFESPRHHLSETGGG